MAAAEMLVCFESLVFSRGALEQGGRSIEVHPATPQGLKQQMLTKGY